MSKLRQLIEAANRKCEMAWKVYSYNPEKDNELVDTSKAFDCIAAAQAHKRDILEKNPNYTVEIIAEAIAKARIDIGNDDIDDAYMDINYAISRDTNYKLKDFKKENSQKNEDKRLDDISTKEAADYIKTLKIGLPLNHPMSINILGTKLKEHFGLSEKPHSIAVKALLDNMPKEYLESANIDVKNPGVLEVPDEKKVDELPQSHFEKLVDKKGYAEVIRALTNLEVWNKDKNKSLSSWASNMADKLKKKYRPESNEKEDKIKKAKKELDDLYYQMARAGAAGIKPPQSMFDRKNELIKFLKANESTQKSESKVNMSKLKNEIQAAVNKYFKDDKDLLEYVHIDTKKDKLGRDILEVRAELGYNDMVKLADHLDKIVTKYDRYAYFDQETSGIMTAVFESAQMNESLRDLNLELADDTNAIAASADKIRQRFEYRTLQNQSYDEKQAEKIYLEIRRELEKAKKIIDACYNKIG